MLTNNLKLELTEEQQKRIDYEMKRTDMSGNLLCPSCGTLHKHGLCQFEEGV